MMNLQITKATNAHARYFQKEVLETGAAYVVSDANSVAGMFSFLFDGNKATMNFPYCVNKKAIELAFNTFIEEYPNVMEIKCLSRQKLDFLGFANQIYTK